MYKVGSSASVGLKPLNCGSVTNPNEPSLTNPLWTSVGQCGPVWTSVDHIPHQPSVDQCGVPHQPTALWTTMDHTSKLSPFYSPEHTFALPSIHFALALYTFALLSIHFALCTFALLYCRLFNLCSVLPFTVVHLAYEHSAFMCFARYLP